MTGRKLPGNTLLSKTKNELPVSNSVKSEIGLHNPGREHNDIDFADFYSYPVFHLMRNSAPPGL